jgi:hypothetical protein
MVPKFHQEQKIRNDPSAALLEMTDDGVTECDIKKKKISVFTMRIILIYT